MRPESSVSLAQQLTETMQIGNRERKNLYVISGGIPDVNIPIKSICIVSKFIFVLVLIKTTNDEMHQQNQLYECLKRKYRSIIIHLCWNHRH